MNIPLRTVYGKPTKIISNGTNNASSIEAISGGMNDAEMCSHCLCMQCNRGPDRYNTCNKCMDCRWTVSMCPINEFKKS